METSSTDTGPPPRPSYASVKDPQTNAQAIVLPASPPPDDGVEKVAVIVTHGMGQQVPFETLELVANAIRTEAEARHHGAPPIAVATRVVRFGIEGKPVEQQLPRAEIRLTLPNGTLRDIHFYEVYWAPLTEGKVTIWDVISFLFSAGCLGIRNTWQEKFFKRWMFGGFQNFEKRTLALTFSFVVAVAVVMSLVVINGTIGVVATAKIFTGEAGGWPSVHQRAALTLEMIIVLGQLALIAVGTVVPRFFPDIVRSSAGRWFAWLCVWTGLAGLPIATLFILRSLLRPPNAAPFCLTWLESKWAALAIWGSILCASWYVRGVLVQYVGDVAAYVNAHTVSKFWEVRKGIYETATRVFDAVYKSRRAEEVPRFQYEKICVVGHSLGSVISYDSLNGLMLEDELSTPPLYIPQRTKLLLTFGSPLDKTAFIFRTHKKTGSEIREASAAAVQPMITSYAHRPRRWINIYSRNDWVSGSLEFYDTNPPPIPPVWPPEPGMTVQIPVENIEDMDANIPLVAHLQYWENALFRETLYDGITEP